MAQDPAVIFRRVASDELEGLLALYKDLAPDDPPLPPERARKIFQQLTASDATTVWVAERGGELVGTCVLIMVPNLSRGGRPFAVIENVVTKAACRNQGIGKALMRHVIAHAQERDCYKIMLQTGSSKEATHNFYKSLGFRDDLKTAYNIRDAVPQVKY